MECLWAPNTGNGLNKLFGKSPRRSENWWNRFENLPVCHWSTVDKPQAMEASCAKSAHLPKVAVDFLNMEATTSTCDLVKRENRWIGWRKHSPLRFDSLKAKKNFSPINWNEVKSRPKANKAKSRTEDKIAKVLKEHGMFVVYSVYLSASHIHLLHLFGRCCFWNMFFSESHIASMSFIHPTLIQSAYSATIVADQQKWTNSCWFVGERYLWVCCHWNL